MPGVSLLENFVSAQLSQDIGCAHRALITGGTRQERECTAAEAADVVTAEDVCATTAGMSRPSAQVMMQLVWLVEAWCYKSNMPLVVMRSCMA